MMLFWHQPVLVERPGLVVKQKRGGGSVKTALYRLVPDENAADPSHTSLPDLQNASFSKTQPDLAIASRALAASISAYTSVMSTVEWPSTARAISIPNSRRRFVAAKCLN